MFRRLVGWFIVLPFAVVVIALAVANRAPVTLAWNPAQAGMPGHGVTLPLFVIAFAFFAAGAIVGGVVVWSAQGRWRRVARERRSEVRNLRAEVDRMRSDPGPAAIAGPR
jgi:uncharacterized integral membrane protein